MINSHPQHLTIPHSNLDAIFDPAECEEYALLWIQPRGEPPCPTNATPAADWVLNVLRAAGWRIVEQHFPRRVYVVIRAVYPQDGQPLVVPPQSFLPE